MTDPIRRDASDRPPLILIVEDHADTRELLTVVLELGGYAVVSAAGGVEGLARARADRPHVILMDLMMPDLDGVTFRHEQLADPAIRDIPVIVASAKADAGAEATRLQAAACFIKPYDHRLLLPRLASILAALG